MVSAATVVVDAEGDPNLPSYDVFIVAFSGGKDSLACLLHLLALGISPEKIELWHHDIDGREGSTLMDWACTRDYCVKVAAAFGVRLFFSWKVGGFEREMLRSDSATAPILFETPEGVRWAGGGGKPNTRRLFPQVSPDLSVRWCSAYLKIDVCAAAVRNQDRFFGNRVLVVTGERAEESTSRARYKTFEPHRSDLRNGRRSRHVDQWRPVHGWTERQVWELIERYRVAVHPAYRLGFGRVSCARCIFGNADQWASARVVDPASFGAVAGYEREFGKTIQRKLTVLQLANKGTPYTMSEADLAAARSHTFDEPIFMAPGMWKLPSGAFGDSCGPT